MSTIADIEVPKGPKFVLYKGKKSKPHLISRALRALAMNLRVGMAEAEALRIVGEQYHKYEIGRSFERASKLMLEGGYSFQQSLLSLEVLPRTARQLIAASNTSQSLHANLQEAAVLVAESATVKKKLIGELIQPGFMLALCLVFLLVSVAFIIPGFLGIFSTLGTETPTLTLLLLDVADVMTWLVGGVIAAVVAFTLFWFLIGRRSPAMRRAMSAFGIRTPAVGSIIQMSATARLFQLLAANLTTGIAEPDALVGAANGCGNEAIRQHCVAHAEKMLNEGAPMRDFAQSKLFPVDARYILASAPSVSQEIDVMLALSPEYNQEANIQLEQLSRTLGPITNYIVYALAGFLVLAILIPMYSIYPSLMDMA